MARKRLFLPSEAQNTQFWNRKHGQKWSTLYQTMCIDTALQIKIVYSGLVVILRQFLAFHGSKKAIFATRGTKYSILKQKTWPKMEHTLPDYVFWYWPSNKTRLQWICHNFMAIFSFLWSKNATFATSGNFETSKHATSATFATLVLH